MSEKEKYFIALHHRAKADLKWVRFCIANAFDVSEEEAYSELNRMHAAPDCEDVEVLGKYSR